ncbi:hypothetical protein [Stackebrandtia nassauensis]|uniref:hypothetical protein n=1 Tax=Stackebrandtia nassauensis TaxID=283811 RepID=UPI0002FC97C5|nr:hypothetical protein [Stackebrandtia nassauensis]
MLVVVVLLWLVPAVADDAMAQPAASPVDPEATYRLIGDSGPEATVTPDASWLSSTGTSGPQLIFQTGDVAIVAQIFADVENIDRLWDRQARLATAANPPVWAQRQGVYTTAKGLSGPTGTLTGNRSQGERFLLASSRDPRTVLGFDIAGPPGSLDDAAETFERFLDSAEVRA